MKLLNVIPSMDPATGGPCQGIRNLNTVDNELGIYREVASMDDPSAAFLGKDTFTIHALGPTKSSWQYTPKLFPWLMENISRFDAVIVNGIWIYHTYAVRKAVNKITAQRKRAGHSSLHIPLVFIMPHGMLDPYFQNTDTRRLKAIRNKFYWKWIEQKNIHSATGIFFTCEQELLLARTTFSPYKPKRECNVSYGVKTPPGFNSVMKDSFLQRCPLPEHASYFLFLSRIHPKKGVDILINAYILLFKSLTPAERLSKLPKLVVAGPNIETVYGQKLKDLVAGTPEITGWVFFTGMLYGDAKAGAFCGCEAFVLASHQENFGISVAEALSCSKPVLISDKINICTEIQHANAGFVDNDTIEGTFNSLKRWINLTEDEKNSMQRNAANCFKSRFAVDRAAAILFDTILQLG